MREAASFIAAQSQHAPAGMIGAWLRDAYSLLRRLSARRKLLALTELDDHLLDDVGLTRADVRWALDLPFTYNPGVELRRRAMRNRACGWRS